MPSSRTLYRFRPSTKNQGSLGTCSAACTVSMYEFLMARLGRRHWRGSMLYQYYNTRLLMGTVDVDSGGFLRSAMKAMAKYGVCREELWQYDTNRFRDEPSSEAYEDGKRFQALTYYRLQTGNLEEMKACIAESYPFVFGFSTFESFQSPEVAKTGRIPMPKADEAFCNGHAVLGIGYDDRSRNFLILNSYGDGWGAPAFPGFFTIPYDYIGNPDLADDFWTLRDIEKGD